ncbi:putative short transmembrane mitochondrial protein [Arabidopsis thaliana]
MILADFAFNSVNLSDQNISNSINPKKKIRSTEKKMGLIRSSFSFITGTVCGIYIAQTYNVPNIKSSVTAPFQWPSKLRRNIASPKAETTFDRFHLAASPVNSPSLVPF